MPSRYSLARTLLLDRVSKENAKAVEDLVPKLLTLAAVQKVLQNLLRERVSIRDAVTILEALRSGSSFISNSEIPSGVKVLALGTVK